MGHRANFVIIENGEAQAYYDSWAGLGAGLAIADGPGPAIELLKEFEPTTELLDWAFAEGGFLIDLDQNVVIVFGELDDMSEEFSEFDDDEDDEGMADEFTEDDEDEGSQESSVARYTNYFAEIAPNWSGWRLRYDDRGVDAFAEHLALRGISTIEVQEPSHPEDVQQLEVEA